MVGKATSRSFANVSWEIVRRIPSRNKKQCGLLLTYMVFCSVTATIAAGAIAFFAAAWVSQEEILSSEYVIMAQGVFQVEILQNLKGIMIVLGVLMVVLVAMKNISESILLYCVARFGAVIETYFGVVLFEGFLNMPYQWHLNQNSADIVLALQWRSFLGGVFFSNSLKIVNDVFLVSFLMVAVFLVNPYVSTVLFAIAGITTYSIYAKIHHLQDREAEKSKEYSISINRQLTKGIHGIKDVKVSGETSFLVDFKEDALRLSRIQGMRSFYGKIPMGLLETIGFSVLAGCILFMFVFTKSAIAEVTGVTSLLVVAAWRIIPAMSRIMSGFLIIRNVLPYIETEMNHIYDIEENAVCVPMLDVESSDCLDFNQEIRLKNVSFVYQDREECVLEDIDFNIKKGQTVGIIGRSGAGKSTLVDIIIGLLEPIRGHVLVDGCELDVRKHYLWMKKLSYVSQSPYILDGTVAENIAFGVSASQIDRDFVLECCRMAYMQDILDVLPEGIDTVIGERGVRLSGGQRQRTAIARALYTRPEILIFDEATSSLDSKSEAAIQETIAALKGMKTLIIVAHRLGTVKICESLVWLENRRVRMFAPPEEVLCEYEESLR